MSVVLTAFKDTRKLVAEPPGFLAYISMVPEQFTFTPSGVICIFGARVLIMFRSTTMLGYFFPIYKRISRYVK